MDSDWCLFCEKHVQDLGAAYCSKECARKDKLMASSPKTSLPFASDLTATSSGNNLSLNFRRTPNQPVSVTYPCMIRSSNFAPSSISSRRGINKTGPYGSSNSNSKLFPSTSVATATTSIRGLPLTRSTTRRQPLVLHD